MSYLPLAVIGIAVAAVVFALAVPRWHARQVLPEVVASVLAAGVALCVLTIVFDTLMIRAGLFRYGSQTLLDVWVWGAPIEDLCYPIAAVLLMPAVWELARRRET
jgi:lycopene cyclase domain-containing protein